LWNGYFSVNHIYEFSSESDRVEQYEGMTVTTGKGVCSNNAVFFRDVMRSLGYEAYDIKNDSYLNLEQENPIYHRYLLIYDGERYIIFDPTWHTYFNIEKINYAESYDGTIKSEFDIVKPVITSDMTLMDFAHFLYQNIIDKSTYSNEEINKNINAFVGKIDGNIWQLEDFYNDIHPYVQEVNSGLEEKEHSM
jgi:hypothetical protein